MTTKIHVFGKVYVSHDLLSFSDYGGAGVVGKANLSSIENDLMENDFLSYISLSFSKLRRLEENNFWDEKEEIFFSGMAIDPPKIIWASGDHSSESVYLLEVDEDEQTEYAHYFSGVFGVLEYCGILSDEELMRIENDWFEEAKNEALAEAERFIRDNDSFLYNEIFLSIHSLESDFNEFIEKYDFVMRENFVCELSSGFIDCSGFLNDDFLEDVKDYFFEFALLCDSSRGVYRGKFIAENYEENLLSDGSDEWEENPMLSNEEINILKAGPENEDYFEFFNVLLEQKIVFEVGPTKEWTRSRVKKGKVIYEKIGRIFSDDEGNIFAIFCKVNHSFYA